MKYILIVFAALLTGKPLSAEAQAFAVNADKMNLVYVGEENRLTIVSGTCSCDELSASADEGELKKLEGCKYAYWPDKDGKITITIKQTKGGKTKVIGTRIFRAKIMNNLYATVGNLRSGHCNIAAFKVQKGVMIQIDNYEPEVVFMVTRFKVALRRQGALLLSEDIRGCYFSRQCTAFFQNLKAGDVVEISGIKCIGPNSGERSLPGITFTMI